MIRLRAGNRHGAGATPGSYSETTAAGLGDLAGEFGVGARVVAVDAAAEHGDRATVCFEGAAVGPAVDAAGEPGDDGDAGGGEFAGEAAGDVGAVVGAGARADDRRRSGARKRVVDLLAAGVELLCGRVGQVVEAAVPDAAVAEVLVVMVASFSM